MDEIRLPAPKAFVCHATEDQDLYATPLATRLRERGVDAWYSEWEIRGGDSVVRKIFDEGIGKAAVFVVLLSVTSVGKPWMAAELDAGVVGNIEGSTRLIPVRVDDCEIPTSLVGKHYLTVSKYGTIEAVADEIADLIFGVHKKPALGDSPAHIARRGLELPGLRPVDARVLELAFDVAIQDGSAFVYTAEVAQRGEAEGIGTSQLLESVDALFDEGLFSEVHDRFSGALKLGPAAVLTVAAARGTDVDLARKRIASVVLDEAAEEGTVDVDELAARMELPGLVAEAIVSEFHDQGMLSWVQYVNQTSGAVFDPTTRLKRWLQDQDAG